MIIANKNDWPFSLIEKNLTDSSFSDNCIKRILKRLYILPLSYQYTDLLYDKLLEVGLKISYNFFEMYDSFVFKSRAVT